MSAQSIICTLRDPAAYVGELGFPVTAVSDGDSIAEAYGVRFIPGLMIVDGQGVVAWKRASTDLPAGKTVAELWDEQVRRQLDEMTASQETGSDPFSD